MFEYAAEQGNSERETEDRFKADKVDDLLNVAINRYHAVPDSLYRLSGKVMTD